jgi:hypothetical protein
MRSAMHDAILVCLSLSLSARPRRGAYKSALNGEAVEYTASRTGTSSTSRLNNNAPECPNPKEDARHWKSRAAGMCCRSLASLACPCNSWRFSACGGDLGASTLLRGRKFDASSKVWRDMFAPYSYGWLLPRIATQIASNRIPK